MWVILKGLLKQSKIMAFNSLNYFALLLSLVCIYYTVKSSNSQKFLLISGSLIFISFYNLVSVFAIVFITVFNFTLLSKLNDLKKNQNRKILFYTGLIFNICLLVLYKVLQAIKESYHTKALEGFDNNRWIILGISFYILQLVGYFIEIYKREKFYTFTLTDFLLPVIFFAKVPSGPILQVKHLSSFAKDSKIKYDEGNISFGLQRILLGLFKKVALADRLTPYVNNVFDKHAALNGINIYLAPLLFTLQVYFDFSSYIDIAIGSARLFGIKLPENFNLPLRANSITSFWRKWHITLIDWLSTYIFYPISFRYRKLKKRGLAIAVTITFLISAFWHGVALTFFIWGLLHVAYIIIENSVLHKYTLGTKGFFRNFLHVVITWHLVSFANIFFRANTLNDVFRLFKDFRRLPFLYDDALVSFKTWLINGGGDIEMEFNYRLSLTLIFGFILLEKKINYYAASEKYNVAFVSALLVLLIVFGMYNSGQRFIYLQF